MKLDEDVKMISAEAPVLFAKAAEIFINELTLRAWIHTEDNKRRTLQVLQRLKIDKAKESSKYVIQER
jgi:histone H3/H4